MHESQASTSHWALGNALQVEKLHGLSKHCLLGVAPLGQPGKIKTWFDIYKNYRGNRNPGCTLSLLLIACTNFSNLAGNNHWN